MIESKQVRLVGVIAIGCLSVPSVGAQESPDVRAMRLALEDRVVVDGVLDEVAWRNAPVAGGLRQQEPTEGSNATERTEIRVLYDETTLYVGVRAYDSEPDRILRRLLQRDRIMATAMDGGLGFAGDDAVALVFDPFHDHRNGMIFATNPNGAEFDAMVTDEGREINIDWRAVWSVKAQQDAQGWSAEFALPLKTLRYPSGSVEPWGFNVYRVIRRKNEEVLWSSWSRDNEGFTRISRAGHLLGLEDLPRAGANVEVKPYVLAGRTEETVGGMNTADGEFDAGVDLKYEVKPGLMLDLTVNTDFAQVEADSEQVNLTRFSIFVPEKRDFFLENAGLFEFGWRSFYEPPPFLLFFSRQIGIAEDDGLIPVIGGARLTGRLGRQTVGLMNMITDRAFGQARTSFSVLRLKRDIGSANYLGGMFTDRRSTDDWNSTGGLDGSFWITPQLNVQGFVAATATSGAGGEGLAYRVGADYQGDKFGINASQLFVSEDANADMGFISRKGMLRNDVSGRFTPRPDVMGLRKVDVFWQVRTVTDTDWNIEDVEIGPGIAPEWESGESGAVWFSAGVSNLDEPFDIGEDVIIPVGNYSMRQLGWFANTSRNRPVVLSSNGMVRWVYDGKIESYSAGLDLTPSANVAVSANFSFNQVAMPTGAFNANVGSVRIAYAFSTQLFGNTLIQYNDLDNELIANLRLNFIHRPGSDLFIVLNEERGAPGDLWRFRSRGSIVKITYLSRF